MALYIDAEKIACHIYEKRNSETWQAAFVCAGSGISEWNLCCLCEGFISAPWTLPSCSQLPFPF